MTTTVDFDLLVLGAGPAGAAAAVFAADKGLNTVILEQRARRPGAAQPELLHPDAHTLLSKVGVASKGAVLGSIESVAFVDEVHDRNTAARLDERIDVVDAERLTETMLDKATSAGATLSTETTITAVQAEEHAVSLVARDGRRFTGRFLIAADGCGSLAVRSFGLDTPKEAAPPATTSCQVICIRTDIPAATKADSNVGLTWVLTADDLTSFGYVFGVRGFLVTRLVAAATADGIRVAFARAVARWKDTGLLPKGMDVDPRSAVVRKVPRAVALDMETHVAKHTLAIGDAGGFVSAVGHEALYPAIWSADLATGVCAEALTATHPQDVLAEFDSRWRRAMVEYLRLPNVDLRFLIPLVFTNERMAHRFANALFSGKDT